MASLDSSSNAECFPSRDGTHATATARETPAAPTPPKLTKPKETTSELDPRRHEEELGRFVVIDTGAEVFRLWLFDKVKQSDPIARLEIPIGLGAVGLLGAAIVAWQIRGVAIQIGELFND
jgi:hypothetical protein